ncbi:CHASE2 domain-containing protein [candidate division CSSED10-310 bacterium]|uniref:CHASE2 domain-containing protein n=1 Tax=candidate division CSSED10-310 bacterium TaxID=2855610 RepID=A0ABV6Z311_UNCC1
MAQQPLPHWVKKYFPLMLALIVAFSLIFSRPLWQNLELNATDFRFRMLNHFDSQTHEASGEVIVVGMEENYLKKKPLIFWYPEIGQFLLKMQEYGAAVVGLDFLPVHSLGQKMTNAAQSILDPAKLAEYEVLLSDLGDSADNSILRPIILISNTVHLVHAIEAKNMPFYYQSLAFTRNYSLSLINLNLDPDQIVRRQNLDYENNLKYFSYAIFQALKQKSCSFDPININFLIDLKTIPYVKFSDIVEGKTPGLDFSGKAVILGYIGQYEDVHPTPLGRLSGSFIHALVVETLLSDKKLTDIPSGVAIAIIIIFTFSGYFISLKFKPLLAVLFIFMLMLLYLGLCFIVFTASYIVPVLPQILAPVIVLTFMYPYRYFLEEREKKRIYNLFGYYIDKNIISDLLQKGEASLSKGEHKDICVLFLDIRDFTALSHAAQTEDIVRFLNFFFEKVTEIIMDQGGFVNKFLGDGLLAFFGTGENPARNALKASRMILEQIEHMNQKDVIVNLTDDTWRLSIGIGLHYGDVIMGNIGSEKKMDFTVIGEAVNIASRIETLTKKTNQPILLSKAVFTMNKDEPDLEFIGEFDIRGIEEKMSIYACLANSDNAIS